MHDTLIHIHIEIELNSKDLYKLIVNTPIYVCVLSASYYILQSKSNYQKNKNKICTYTPNSIFLKKFQEMETKYIFTHTNLKKNISHTITPCSKHNF